MTRRVYLDYNATAPLRAEAKEAMAAALEVYGNPSSVHEEGRKARALVEKARGQVAALVGAKPQEVVFASGGTEANNFAIRGLIDGRRPAEILYSAIEHPSIAECAVAQGLPTAEIPVTADGVVDVAWLKARLEGLKGPALVCVMLANNETGVIQPIEEIAEIVKSADGVLLCDAVQAAGKIPVKFRDLGVHGLTLSAHKIGGPKGVGALVLREGVPLQSRLKGGGQELGRRAGTENVPGIAGFGAAAEAAMMGLGEMQAIGALRNGLEEKLAKAAPDLQFYGREANRLPTTLSMAAPGFASETQVMTMDLAGIAISAGSACSSGKVTPSHVLRAMGADEAHAGAVIRVSLGWETTAADVDAFADAWLKAYERVRSRAGKAA